MIENIKTKTLAFRSVQLLYVHFRLLIIIVVLHWYDQNDTREMERERKKHHWIN